MALTMIALPLRVLPSNAHDRQRVTILSRTSLVSCVRVIACPKSTPSIRIGSFGAATLIPFGRGACCVLEAEMAVHYRGWMRAPEPTQNVSALSYRSHACRAERAISVASSA